LHALGIAKIYLTVIIIERNASITGAEMTPDKSTTACHYQFHRFIAGESVKFGLAADVFDYSSPRSAPTPETICHQVWGQTEMKMFE
jgi:hypothetical protein